MVEIINVMTDVCNQHFYSTFQNLLTLAIIAWLTWDRRAR